MKNNLYVRFVGGGIEFYESDGPIRLITLGDGRILRVICDDGQADLPADYIDSLHPEGQVITEEANG